MAFDQKIYLDFANGNDTTGDGSFQNPWKTFQGGAKNTFDNAGLQQYEFIFLRETGEYAEGTLSGRSDLGTPPNVPFAKFTFVEGVSDQFVFVLRGYLNLGMFFKNLSGLGDTDSFFAIDRDNTHSIFEKCNIENADLFFRDNGLKNTQFLNCNFKNVTFRSLTDSPTKVERIQNLHNCSFDNCNLVDSSATPFPSLGFLTFGYETLEYNHIKNGKYSFYVNSGNPQPNINRCKIESIEAAFHNDVTGKPSLIDFTPALSMNDIQNKFLADLGYSTTEFETSDFGSIILDAFGFPSLENDSQIKNKYIGWERYSKSLSVANDEYSIVDGSAIKISNYLTLENIGDSATILFSAIIPRARFLRRIEILYKKEADSFEYLDESSQIFRYNYTNETSVNSDSYKSGLVNLGSENYDYDLKNVLVKKIEAELKIVSSTTSQKLKIFGIVFVLNDQNSLLPQNRTEETIIQPSNVWIETDYAIKRPEELKDEFITPSKVDYFPSEMLTEADNNPNITILHRDDNPINEQRGQQINTITGPKLNKTFE